MFKKILISIPILIFTLVSPVAPSLSFGLNTKKIDTNIEKLLTYSWFQELYFSEQFRHLFFANKNVRKKLSNNFFVMKLISQKKTQDKFCRFLEKENIKNKE